MTYNTCCKIFQINSILDLPGRIMDLLFSKAIEERNAVYRELLVANNFDVGKDWFQEIFEAELSEGKRKGQHFTPSEIYKLLPELVNNPENRIIHEPTAGNGGLIIGDWWNWASSLNPWRAKPSERIYVAGELSERNIPILLLNLSIRGINAVVFHGDILELDFVARYHVINPNDDFLSFSNIIKIQN